MMKTRRILVAIALTLLVGCYSGNEGGCRSKPLDQRQADYVAWTLVVEQFNKSQTNWTLTLTERTNAPALK